jgi:hypothetical protein
MNNRVYISSTYVDLIPYRAAVTSALRQGNFEIVGMEDYGASDARPLHRCLADVASCSIYVGLFAWRYGFIPDHDNPTAKSITELEYRCAQQNKLKCLIFLLDEEQPWMYRWIDRGVAGDRIIELRSVLATHHMVGSFREPGDLATMVVTAAYNAQREAGDEQKAVSDQIKPMATKSIPAPSLGARPAAGPIRLFSGGHRDPVECVSFSPDAAAVATGSWDKTIRIWETSTGRPLAKLVGHAGAVDHPGTVNGVAFLPDGRRLLSCGNDGTLRLWDWQKSKEIRKLIGHDSPVNGLVVVPGGAQAVTVGQDATIRVWDLEMARSVRTMTGHTAQIRSVSISGDGTTLLTGGMDKTLRLWDMRTGAEIKRLSCPGPVLRACLSSTLDFAVSGGPDGLVRVWDIEGERESRRLAGHTGTIRFLDISPDGCRVLSSATDRTVRLWDAGSGASLAIFADHPAPATAVEFSPDGSMAIAGYTDGTAQLFSLPQAPPGF